MNADVLLLGATGRTGRLVARGLVERGCRLRTLVRDPGSARGILGPDVELVAGDLRDADAVASAASGCRKLVFTAAANGDTTRGVPREIECDAIAAIVAAVDREKTDHIVLLSSAAVSQPEHPHNCSFNSVLKWKYRGEEVLRRSGLPYTIVRALGLRDRPASLQGVRIVQGDRIAFGEDIARADVARFLVDIALSNDGRPSPGSGFGASFDVGSFFYATCEIYNDARIAGGQWRSALPRLASDAPARVPVAG